MAHPRSRAANDAKSPVHVICAIMVVVADYLLSGLLAEGTVATTRYWSG